MKPADCIFCRIASGEIPGAVLYNDEHFRVILDVGPASKGHALVIPKEHYENIYEMPDDLLKDAFLLAKNMAGRLKEVVGCDGMNILQNNGVAAGQTVFHFHIHLIPRVRNDKIGITWKSGNLAQLDKNEILSKFKTIKNS